MSDFFSSVSLPRAMASGALFISLGLAFASQYPYLKLPEAASSVPTRPVGTDGSYYASSCHDGLQSERTRSCDLEPDRLHLARTWSAVAGYQY
jgi:hypothetical protein